ncbi:protein DA1-related 1-like isoform X1 [Miscanthus floridulus]|uniref:protein DA1-related 1-like isoform X1 n=1 Tax=Miscanthus floridulus TaxID=154761 RepID=UPI0034575358
MGWLSKIFKGSVNRVSRGHYNGNSHEGYSTQHTKSYGAHGNEDEDMDHAIALSLSEEDQRKGKAIDTGHHLDEDEELARALQENTGHDLDEDEQLARALQESMNDGPPRQDIPIEDVHSESAPASGLPSNIFPTSGLRVCAGCKSPIGRGRFLSCMDSVWHPECFRCYACDKPISEYEFAVHENHAYHRPCYKECFHPKCDVCSSFIPTNKNGLIEYRAHPFWMQKYCPSHENDGTPRCCSCERMEPKDSQYITLDDGRRLCLECLHTAIMETNECQPLYIDIQEFYEGMNMKVEQQVPLLLVERQALNEAMEAEKSVHHLPETRGLCLSEEQIVRTILKRPIIGPGNRIIDMITGPYKLIRRCEVTAILILYGLPRLLTGSILAHEMMHAFLRLKGYRTLSPEVEEGICQVLAHLWLESEITSGSGSMATTSDASSSSLSTSSSSKKGAKTEFEKRLGEFFKYQIETDSSVAYGDGFRAGMRAVERYGLRSTLDHIKMTGSFPY